MKKTIMISSHILPELAEICDQIGVIEKGRMLACGSVEEMALRVKGIHVLLVRVLKERERAARILEEHPQVKQVDDQRDHLRVMFTGSKADQAALLKYLLAEEVPVVDFSADKENLEDVFLAITERMGS